MKDTSTCSIEKLSFCSIFSFLLQLPISSVSQIIKELSSSSSSSFHFCHLSFNGIATKAINSWNIINQLTFTVIMLFRSVLFSPIRSITSSLVTFSNHFIFSILLQNHIWKLSKYLLSNFLSVKISEPYIAML